MGGPEVAGEGGFQSFNWLQQHQAMSGIDALDSLVKFLISSLYDALHLVTQPAQQCHKQSLWITFTIIVSLQLNQLTHNWHNTHNSKQHNATHATWRSSSTLLKHTQYPRPQTFLFYTRWKPPVTPSPRVTRFEWSCFSSSPLLCVPALWNEALHAGIEEQTCTWRQTQASLRLCMYAQRHAGGNTVARELFVHATLLESFLCTQLYLRAFCARNITSKEQVFVHTTLLERRTHASALPSLRLCARACKQTGWRFCTLTSKQAREGWGWDQVC